MDENTIQALLNLETTKTENGTFVMIPYEEILRGTIKIEFSKVEHSPLEQLNSNPPISFSKEISSMYSDDTIMIKDGINYLHCIARCWRYHNLSIQTSVLKKAASEKPHMNTLAWRKYGKDSDVILLKFINMNKDYIASIWNGTVINKLKQNEKNN